MAIPENIEQLANDVRTKIYGKDVREALASGIEAAGETAEDARIKSEDTETDLRLDADGTIHATGGASMRFGQKGRMLDYNETALSHGYKKFIPLVFEKNGIVYSSGADMTSESSIRTPSANKVAFSGNIRVFNTKTSLYRWRYVVYNADGSYNSYVDWKTNAELTVTPDVNLLYRFEIGTIDGSTINMEDALKNIKMVYVSDDFGFTLDNIYDITDYILAIGGGQKPTFTKRGNNIEVTMPSTSLFFRDNSGKQIAKSPSQYYNQKFTVGSDEVLVWNLDTNTILVQGVTKARSKRNVVLLYNLYGQVQDGALKSYYDNQSLLESVINPVTPNITFISRQGEIGGYPENSMHGIKFACENGYKNVRVSVNITSDNVPVLLHDATINRLARNMDGSEIAEPLNIRDLTLEQVNSYDWGRISGKPELYGLDITTLEEFVRYAKYKGIDIRLELKGDYTNSDIDNILSILLKYGMIPYTTFASDIRTVLDLIYSKCSSCNFALIGHFSTNLVDAAVSYKNASNTVYIDIFSDDYDVLNDTNLLYTKNNDILIKVGSARTLDDLYKWFESGIDALEVAFIANPAIRVTENYKDLN